MTWEYFSMTISSFTATLPGFDTLPTSFRPRSTSIMCSAHSFGSARSSFVQRLVFFFGGPSFPGPRDRPQVYPRAFHPDHHFGRGAGQDEVAAVQVEHIRRRVYHPERPVHVERVDRRLFLEPLGEHDLKDVARLDIFLRGPYGIFEVLFCKAGFKFSGNLWPWAFYASAACPSGFR